MHVCFTVESWVSWFGFRSFFFVIFFFLEKIQVQISVYKLSYSVIYHCSKTLGWFAKKKVPIL